MLIGYKPDGTSYRFTKGGQRGDKQTPDICIPWCKCQFYTGMTSFGARTQSTGRFRTKDALEMLLPYLYRRDFTLYDTVRMSKKGWLRAIVITQDKVLRPIVFGVGGPNWRLA